MHIGDPQERPVGQMRCGETVREHTPPQTVVDDLACTIRAGDWPAAQRLGDYLSVDVSVA